MRRRPEVNIVKIDNNLNHWVDPTTLLSPEIQQMIAAYQEANGMLALEAESGVATAVVGGHAWVSQTVQPSKWGSL